MDAYSGYNQIMMHEDDKAKTFFIIERGTYCYKVMPFGLKNTGATYLAGLGDMKSIRAANPGRSWDTKSIRASNPGSLSEPQILALTVRASPKLVRQMSSALTKLRVNWMSVDIGITEVSGEDGEPTGVSSEGGEPAGVSGEDGAPAGVSGEDGEPTGVSGEGGESTGASSRGGEPAGVSGEREKATVRVASYQQRLKSYFDKRTKIRQFQLGDLVLRKAFITAQRQGSKKMKPNWVGPYVISRSGAKRSYTFDTMEGKEIPRQWNACHLQRYNL
ncbi:hypothetical protein L3X38_023047 [Prunus dulcis]|uniref:Uncharacterized protein n=1 Tax=Prunus dulcis TaxID=3755 RepID=A0AAD4Z5S1_PRUDU|nr:hypothetical protein L3X38_023047 [Prunus dulcis]